MNWSTTPIQDTTIYESDPNRNSGLDQILELKKTGDSSTSDLGEARSLLKFDLSELSSILSENNVNINSVSASLRLFTVQESELPRNYVIEARALAKDWTNGSGYLSVPAGTISDTYVSDGATWYTTAGTGSTLWTSSLSSGATYYYNTNAGGASWYTSSIASQSFSFTTSDNLSIDVTNIVRAWYSGSLPNYGFLLAFKHDQITGSNSPLTNIQLYSVETNTVFQPQLYINWTGSVTYNTGSMSVLTYESNPVVYVRTFKGEFQKNKKVRILLGSRPKYPRPVFQQNSIFSGMGALPSASYYQIKDAHNNQILIPYGNDTLINTNASGSYFDFYTTMMYGERYYKFEIKAVFSDFTQYFTSNDFTFKIIN